MNVAAIRNENGEPRQPMGVLESGKEARRDQVLKALMEGGVRRRNREEQTKELKGDEELGKVIQGVMSNVKT